MNGAGSRRARASPVPGARCEGCAARDARAGEWRPPAGPRPAAAHAACLRRADSSVRCSTCHSGTPPLLPRRVPGSSTASCASRRARTSQGAPGRPGRRRRGQLASWGDPGGHSRVAVPRAAAAIGPRPGGARPSARRPGCPRRGAPPQRRPDLPPPPLYASRGPAPPATRRTHGAPAPRKDPARRPGPRYRIQPISRAVASPTSSSSNDSGSRPRPGPSATSPAIHSA